MEARLIPPYISKPNEISNDDYHNSDQFKDFISSTGLKQYAISPKYARWAQLHPKDFDSEALRRGSVYHDMLFSLVNFGDLSYFNTQWAVFDPPINPGTQAPYGATSKKFLDEFELQKTTRGITDLCGKNEMDEAITMIDELRNGSRHLSHIINQFIKNGKAEQSHFLEYQGQKFKYRTDVKTKKAIIDWKTTTLENPKVENFARQIFKFGYDISAAMYQFLDFQMTGKWRKFYWVVQEKQPPYDFNILDSSEWTWKVHPGGEVEPGRGAMVFIKLMEKYILCNEAQEWEGYSIFTQPDWKNYRIGIPEVPGWVKQQDFNFFND